MTYSELIATLEQAHKSQLRIEALEAKVRVLQLFTKDLQLCLRAMGFKPAMLQKLYEKGKKP